MGINYYLYFSRCAECQKELHAPIHIGKETAGCFFALHIYPPEINNLDDWEKRWSGTNRWIQDSCGEKHDAKHMKLVINKHGGKNRKHHPLGDHCVANEAKYDCVVGYFS